MSQLFCQPCRRALLGPSCLLPLLVCHPLVIISVAAHIQPSPVVTLPLCLPTLILLCPTAVVLPVPAVVKPLSVPVRFALVSAAPSRGPAAVASLLSGFVCPFSALFEAFTTPTSCLTSSASASCSFTVVPASIIFTNCR